MTKTTRTIGIAILSLIMAVCLTIGLVFILSPGGETQLASADAAQEINYVTVGKNDLEINDGVLSGFKVGGRITVDSDGYASFSDDSYKHENYVAGSRIRVEVPESVKYIAEGAFSDCVDVADIIIPNDVYWQVKNNSDSPFKIDNTLKYATNDGQTATISAITPANVKANLIIPSPIWYDENANDVMEETEGKYTYTEYLGDISFGDSGNKITAKNLLITANVINLYAANQEATAVTPENNPPHKHVEEGDFTSISIDFSNTYTYTSNGNHIYKVTSDGKDTGFVIQDSSAPSVSNNRLNFGGTIRTSTNSSGSDVMGDKSISFTVPQGSYVLSAEFSRNTNRKLGLYKVKADGSALEQVAESNNSTAGDNSPVKWDSNNTFTAEEETTYYVGSTGSGIYIYSLKIEAVGASAASISTRSINAPIAGGDISAYSTSTSDAGVPKIEGSLRKSDSIENIFFATGRTTVLSIFQTTFEDYTNLKIISLSAGVLLADGARAFQGATGVEHIYVANEQNSAVPSFYVVGEGGALYSDSYAYNYYNRDGMRQYLQWRADNKLLGEEFSGPAAAAQSSVFSVSSSTPVMSPADSGIMPTALDGVKELNFDNGVTVSSEASSTDVYEWSLLNADGSETGFYAYFASKPSVDNFEATTGTRKGISTGGSSGTEKKNSINHVKRAIGFEITNAGTYNLTVEYGSTSTGRYATLNTLNGTDLNQIFAGENIATAKIVYTWNQKFEATENTKYYVGCTNNIFILSIKVAPVSTEPAPSTPTLTATPDKDTLYALGTGKSRQVTITVGAQNFDQFEFGKVSYQITGAPSGAINEGEATGVLKNNTLDIKLAESFTAAKWKVEGDVAPAISVTFTYDSDAASQAGVEIKPLTVTINIEQYVPTQSVTVTDTTDSDNTKDVTNGSISLEMPLEEEATSHTLTYKATATGDLPGTPAPVTFNATENNGVLEVVDNSEEGKVTIKPLEAGEAKLSFTSGTVTATVTVKVTQPAKPVDYASKVEADSTLSLKAGKSTSFKVTVTPETADKYPELFWYVSASGIITITDTTTNSNEHTITINGDKSGIVSVCWWAYSKDDTGYVYCNTLVTVTGYGVSAENCIKDQLVRYQRLVYMPANYKPTGESAPAETFEFVYNETTEIGGSAFLSTQLTVIDIPDSVSKIGDYAFRFSDQLQTVYLPNDVEFGHAIFGEESDADLNTTYTAGKKNFAIVVPSRQTYQGILAANSVSGSRFAFKSTGSISGGNNGYDYIPYLTYEMEITFNVLDPGTKNVTATQTQTYLYNRPASFVKAADKIEWSTNYNNNADDLIYPDKNNPDAKTDDGDGYYGNTLPTNRNWYVTKGGWYDSETATFPTVSDNSTWYYGAIKVSDDATAFLAGEHSGEIKYIATYDYTDPCVNEKDTAYKAEKTYNIHPYRMILTSVPTENQQIPAEVTAPALQSVGDITLGEDYPTLTVTFDFAGFPASRIFAGLDPNRISVNFTKFTPYGKSDAVEPSTDKNKGLIAKNVAYDAGEYIIELSLIKVDPSSAIKDLVYRWVGTYNGSRIPVAANTSTLTFRLIIEPRVIEAGDMFAKYNAHEVTVYENNAYYTAESYAKNEESSGSTPIEGLPIDKGSYAVNLKLRDPKYPDGDTPNLKFPEGVKIKEDGTANVTLTISETPLITRPTLKAYAVGTVEGNTLTYQYVATETAEVTDLLNGFDDGVMKAVITKGGASATSIKAVGTYTISVTPAAGYNWDNGEGESGGNDPVEFTIIINKRVVAVPETQYIYDISNPPVGGFVYDVDPTAVYSVDRYTNDSDGPIDGKITGTGNYKVYLKLKDSASYEWAKSATIVEDCAVTSLVITTSKDLTVAFKSKTDLESANCEVVEHSDTALTLIYKAGRTYGMGELISGYNSMLLTRTVEYPDGQRAVSEVGTYKFTYALNGTAKDNGFTLNGNTDTVTFTLTIKPIPVERPAEKTSIKLSELAEAYPASDFYNITYAVKDSGTVVDNVPTTKGTYTVTFELKDTTHYEWKGGGVEDIVYNITVGASTTLKLPTAKTNLIYKGTEYGIDELFDWNNDGNASDYVNYSITVYATSDAKILNAGTYTITFTVKAEDGSVEFSGGTTTCTVEVTIAKATLTKPSADSSSAGGAYKNAAYEITVENFDNATMEYELSGGSFDGNKFSATAASDTPYTLTIKIKETGNYEWDGVDKTDPKFTIQITKAQLTIGALEDYTYNGSDQFTAIEGDIKSKITNSSDASVTPSLSSVTVTKSEDEVKNADTYSITVTLSDDNFEFADGTNTCTVEVTIAQKEITLNPEEKTYIELSYPKQSENINSPKSYKETPFKNATVDDILPGEEADVSISFDIRSEFNSRIVPELWPGDDEALYDPVYTGTSEGFDFYSTFNLTTDNPNYTVKQPTEYEPIHLIIIPDIIRGFDKVELKLIRFDALAGNVDGGNDDHIFGFSTNRPSGSLWEINKPDLPSSRLETVYSAERGADGKLAISFDFNANFYFVQLYGHTDYAENISYNSILSNTCIADGQQYNDQYLSIKSQAVVRDCGTYTIVFGDDTTFQGYIDGGIGEDSIMFFSDLVPESERTATVTINRMAVEWCYNGDYNGQFTYNGTDYYGVDYMTYFEQNTQGDVSAFWTYTNQSGSKPLERNHYSLDTEAASETIVKYVPQYYDLSTQEDEAKAAFASAQVVTEAYDVGTYYVYTKMLNIPQTEYSEKAFQVKLTFSEKYNNYTYNTYYARNYYYDAKVSGNNINWISDDGTECYKICTVKPVTLTVEFDGTSKTYDGENVPLKVSGLMGEDKTHTVSEYLTAISAKDAGTYSLSLTESSATTIKIAFKTKEEGNTTRINSQNYILQLGSNTEFTINKYNLSLESNEPVVTYSGNAVTLDQIRGDLSLESLTGEAIENLLDFDLSKAINVGTYRLTQTPTAANDVKVSLKDDKNYTLTILSTNTFKITPADVSVTISGGFTYDGKTHSGNDILSQTGVTATFSGTTTVGLTKANLTFTVTDGSVKDAKTYTVGTDITVAIAGTSNYTLTAATGTITINKADVTSITWEVSDKADGALVGNSYSAVYDGKTHTVTATVKYAGGSEKMTLNTFKNVADSGDFTANATDNFDIPAGVAKTLSVTINKATITVSGKYSYTKYYTNEGGLDNYYEQEVTLPHDGISLAGIVETDKDEITVTLKFHTSSNEEGKYSNTTADKLLVVGGSVADKNGAGVAANYKVEIAEGFDAKLEVSKRSATVVWKRGRDDFDQNEVIYFAGALELTAQTSGGQPLTVSVSAQEGSLTEGKARNVGKYVFTARSEVYALTNAKITVTITPYVITLEGHNSSHGYDFIYGENPVLTGIKGGSATRGSETVNATYTLDATDKIKDGKTWLDAGDYTVVPSNVQFTVSDGANVNNYTYAATGTYKLRIAPFKVEGKNEGDKPYIGYKGGYKVTVATGENDLGISVVASTSQLIDGRVLANADALIKALKYSLTFSDVDTDADIQYLVNANRYNYTLKTDDANYQLTYSSGTIRITKTTINAELVSDSVVSDSVVYNGEVQNAHFKLTDNGVDVTSYFFDGDKFVNFDSNGKFGSGETPVITVKYSGKDTTPLNAGEYTVTLTLAGGLGDNIDLVSSSLTYEITAAPLTLSGNIDLVAYAASHTDFATYMTFSGSAKTVKISNAYAIASLGANSYNLPLSDFADLFDSVEDSLYGMHVVITIGASSEAVENKKVILSAENISFETEGSADNFNITVSSAATYTIKPYQTEVSWKYMGAAVVSVGGVPTVTHIYNGKRLFNEGLITYSAHHVDGEEVTLNADNTSRDIKLARDGNTYSIEIIRSVGEYTVTVETSKNKNYKLTNNVIKIIINPYVIDSELMSNLLVYRNATTTNILQSGTYSYGGGAPVTAYNSFAQYREGGNASEITYNKSGTITLPNDGTVVGYENIFDFAKENVKGNTGTAVGLYNMTFTLALKPLTHTDTGLTFNNYVWDDDYYNSLHAGTGRNYGETITHNSDDTLSVQKTWYIVEFPNGLKSQLVISGNQWTFGEKPEITSYPAARREGAKMLMSFGTYKPGVTDYDHGYDGTADWIKHWSEVHELGRTNFIHKDNKDLPVLTDGDIKAFIDKWLNASTPAGQYMLVVIIQEAEVIGEGGANITYEEFSASYMFTVNGASLSLTSEQIAKQAEGYRHAYDGEAHYPAADTDLQLATTIDFSKLRGTDTDKNGWANSTITRPGATTLTVNIDEEFYGNIKGAPEISLVYSGEWENGYHTADDPTWCSESNVYLPLKVNVETVGGAPANMPYKLYYKIAVANFGEFITVDGDVLSADEQFFNMYITAQQLDVKVEGQDEAVSWIFGQKTTLTISVDNYTEVIKTNAITGKKDEISLGYRFVDSSSATQYDAVSVELSSEGTVQINIPAALQKHGSYTLRVFMGDYNVGSFINNNYNYVVADGKDTLTGIKEFTLTVNKAEISDTNNGGHPVPTDRNATYSFRPLDYLSAAESSFYGVLYEQDGSCTKNSVALLKGEYTVWVYLLDSNYVWAEEMGAQTKSVDGVSYSCVQRKFTVDPREIWLAINPAELKSEYTGSVQQFTDYQIATKGADGDFDDIVRLSSGLQSGTHFKVEYYLNGETKSLLGKDEFPLGAAVYTVRITLIYNPFDNVYAAENLVFAGFVDRDHKALSDFEGTISDDGDYKSAIAEFTFEITPVKIKITEKEVDADHKHIYNGTDYSGSVFESHYTVSRDDDGSKLNYLPENGYALYFKDTEGNVYDKKNLINAGTYTVWFKLLGDVDVLGTWQDFARNYQLRIDGKDIGLEEVKAGVQIGTFTIDKAEVKAFVTDSLTYNGKDQFSKAKKLITCGADEFSVTEKEMINAATYELTVTITDGNHKFAGESEETTSVSVTIAPFHVTAKASGEVYYNGNPQTATVTFSGDGWEGGDLNELLKGKYNVTYMSGGESYDATKIINAKTYNVTVTSTDPNFEIACSGCQFTISPAHISVEINEKFTYTGKGQEAQLQSAITLKNLHGGANVPNISCTIEGGSFLNAGTYNVTVKIDDPNNYDIWNSDNSEFIHSAEVKLAVVMHRAPVTTDKEEYTAEFNGYEQSPDVKVRFGSTELGTQDYEVGKAKFGENDITVTLLGSAANNYTFVEDEEVITKKIKFIIKAITISAEVSGGGEYNGSAYVANVQFKFKGLPLGITLTENEDYELTYNGEAEAVNAGTYTVGITFINDAVKCYILGEVSGTLVITKALVTASHSGTYTYDGTDQFGDVVSNITLSQNVAFHVNVKQLVDAGDYELTVVLDNANYTFADDKNETVITVTIAKALVTASHSGTYTYDGTDQFDDVVSNITLSPNVESHVNEQELINAGKYELTVVLDNANYTFADDKDETVITVTIAKALVTASHSGTYTYDGTDQFGDVVSNIKLSPNVKFHVNEQELINAGKYELTVVLDNANYTFADDKNETVITVTIAKAEITINYGGVNEFRYTGRNQFAELVAGFTFGSEESVPVPSEYIYLINGEDSGEFTEIGRYTVTVTLTAQDNKNFELKGDTSVSVRIFGVIVSRIEWNYKDTYVYTGEVLAAPEAYAITELGRLEMNVSADGEFKNVGKYTFSATLGDDYIIDSRAATTLSLSIHPAKASIAAKSFSAVYDGSAHTLPALKLSFAGGAIGADEYTVTGPAQVIDAGTYIYTLKLSDNYTFGATRYVTVMYTISKARVTLASQAVVTETYNGEAHSAPAIEVKWGEKQLKAGADYTVKAPAGDLVNAGEYVYSIQLSNNFTFGSSSVAETKLVISKAVAELARNAFTATYDGKAHTLPELTVTVDGAPLAANEYAVTAPVDEVVKAGEYAFKVTLTDNYTFGDSATAEVIFTVQKAQAEVSAEDLTVTYDGEAHAIAAPKVSWWVDSGNVVITYNGYKSAPVSAGVYEVTVKVPGTADYLGAEKVVTLTINKKTVTVNWSEDSEFNYSGKAETPYLGVEGISESLVNVIYSAGGSVLSGAPTEAGDYSVSVQLKAGAVGNYQLSGTTSKSFTIKNASVPEPPVDEPPVGEPASDNGGIDNVVWYAVLAIGFAAVVASIPCIIVYLKKRKG